MIDLAKQIRELIDGSAPPVSLGEITDRAHAPLSPVRPGQVPRSRLRLVWPAVAVAGVIAVGCAGAIIAAQLTAARHPAGRGGAVLTAAQMRRVTAASRAALEHSAQAYITYGSPGPYRAFQSEYVTFSGQNYSFAGSVINPAPGGRPGQVTWFAERVVNGQDYDHEFGSSGWHWVHYTNTPGGPVVRILDPRTMLRVLAPSERFRDAGRVVVGGVPLKRLQATSPAKVPGLSSLTNMQAGGYVTALDVLVDRQGVVHRVDISFRETTLVAAARGRKPVAGAALAGQGSLLYGMAGSTNITVTFADIGQPQTITAPPHAIDVKPPWRVARRPLPNKVFLSAGAAGG